MARTSNLQYWKQAIADQTDSGLTQAKWCEQNDVNIHNFRYWKNRLKRDENSNIDNITSSAPTWTLVTTSSATSTVKPPESGTGEIDIQVGKVKMTLRNSVDPNLLSDVLEVLMHYVQ